MTRHDLVVAGRCVIEGEIRDATVAVSNGRIVAVNLTAAAASTGLTGRVEVALAADEVLLPGLVDTHVHVNEPGRTDWEGFDSATRSAAAGGVTTIIDMPLNSIPPTVDLAALETKRRASDGKRHTDVGLWGGAIPSSLGHLRELHEAGVFGFKCFLAPSGVDEFPALDAEQLDAAMREVASFGGLLIVHAEDAQLLAEAPTPSGARYVDFLASRPDAAEDAAIAAVLAGAARHAARVHILHLSSSVALGELSAAREAGLAVTIETCPHYLTLDAEEIPDGQTQFKCCPPIRKADNKDRLWEALRDGVIDCVVSDHSPSTPDLKRLDSGDFGAAWGGISSLQLGLSLTWTEASSRGHALPDVVAWMASRPAEIVGLEHKGRIRVGCDADFTVFAPDETFVVIPAELHHKNPITPYAGKTLSGVVRQTWLHGRRVEVARAASAGPTDQTVARPATAGPTDQTVAHHAVSAPFGQLLSRGDP
ncbi:MAG: allantoinase AllB [Nocardioidaceae bacterium]